MSNLPYRTTAETAPGSYFSGQIGGPVTLQIAMPTDDSLLASPFDVRGLAPPGQEVQLWFSRDGSLDAPVGGTDNPLTAVATADNRFDFGEQSFEPGDYELIVRAGGLQSNAIRARVVAYDPAAPARSGVHSTPGFRATPRSIRLGSRTR